MKTTDTAFKTAVYAETFDDIIFDGRNHKYGAYFLRKTYTNNLSLSMLATLCAAALVSFLLIRYAKNPPPVEIPESFPTDITITPTVYNPVFPPPPLPDIEIPKEATGNTTSGELVVVDEVTNNDPVPTQQELGDRPTGPSPGGTGVLAYVEPTPDGVVDEKVGYYGYEVTEQAMFKGGSVENFRAWLIKKIRYPEEAAINGIKGTVFVKFAVGRDGKICEVVVEKGIHPLIDGAVVKTLLSSPEWKPAKRNGKPVKVFYTMPVMFDLQQ